MPVMGGRKAGVMPKETVHDEAGMYDITVGWERDRHMQVGIQTHDGRSLIANLNHPNGGDDSAEPAGFKSLWGSVDRAGANRLIKALRHARDEAFGRDE